MFGIDDTTLTILCLGISAYLGILANHHKYLSRISGVAVTMLSGALFSNLHIIPSESAFYDMVWKYFVPVTLPLLLLGANLKTIYKETGVMLVVYTLGAIGTIVGALLSYFFISLGGETHKIIGMLAASNIGGSINFVATSEYLQLKEKSFFLAGNAADNIVMAIYFFGMTLMAKSTKIVSFFEGKRAMKPMGRVQETLHHNSKSLIEAPFLAVIIGFSFFCIAKAVMHYFYFDGGVIIIVTVLALLLVNLFPEFAQNLRPAEGIANILIMVFFAVIGANCNLRLVLEVAPHLFTVMAFMTICQFLFALGGARFFKIGLRETIIACNANAGGPATASAMASSYGWHHLVVPGILCGTLGYAIGTFIGIFIGNFLASF